MEPDEDEFDDQTGKSCYSILENQAVEISTAHGYPIIFKAETWFGKLIWSLIFLGALAAFIRQTYLLMDRFFDYPVSVEVRIFLSFIIPSPFCNTVYQFFSSSPNRVASCLFYPRKNKYQHRTIIKYYNPEIAAQIYYIFCSSDFEEHFGAFWIVVFIICIIYLLKY